MICKLIKYSLKHELLLLMYLQNFKKINIDTYDSL